MIVCIPVDPHGSVGGSWGRAARVAVSRVEDGAIAAWDEYPVGWDVLHDEGTEGGHHARVARFLQDHAVEMVVAGHMGPPMARMLDRMGIAVRSGASGLARDDVLEGVASGTPTGHGPG